MVLIGWRSFLPGQSVKLGYILVSQCSPVWGLSGKSSARSEYYRVTHLDMRASENIDGRKARHARQAVPQVDRKADITSPKRVSTAPEFVARVSALRNGRHRECPRSFEPHGILPSAIELEERVTVTASAM